MATYILFLFISAIAFYISSIFVKWRYSYWKRRGIPQIEPVVFPYGNVKGLLTGKTSLSDTYLEFYKTIRILKERYSGVYSALTPVFVPVDPELIKQILLTDFSHFNGHGVYHHSKDIFSEVLFRIEGPKWKHLRAKLTPAFTSGKLKMMFEGLIQIADVLKNVTEKSAIAGEPLNVKDLMARFTTDIIGTCGFGIDCNSLEHPECDFRKYGKMVFKPNGFKFLLEDTVIPWSLLGHLGYKTFGGPQVEKFFSNLIKETVNYREENNIFRKDFIHLMIQLKNQGVLSENDSFQKEQNSNKDNFLSEQELLANIFIFFAAGFETSSSTMTFALFELAQNQSVQDKMRSELKEVLERCDEELTYDAIMEMTYTDKVVKEALRKFPPIMTLPRLCNKDYRISGTDVIIEKGTLVQIPVWGLQKDPEYFSDPEEFNPENFSNENLNKRHDFTWLAFGEGPRMCIGMRLGILMVKVGLIAMIRNFKFNLNEKTPKNLTLDKGSFVTVAKQDILLNVELITE